MNPTKVALPLFVITSSLLLILGGCEGMQPTGSNPPAVVPNPQPGAAIPGGLRIVSAHATPLHEDFSDWKKGAVNVRFNGAATTPGVVEVEAQNFPPLSMFFSAGSAKFVPGQTDVQVPIRVDVGKSLREAGGGSVQIPLKVKIRGASEDFQTMTHYRKP
jgi:hypothetical protein